MQVFGGDADDTLVDTQEERLLRMWLNSLHPRMDLPSLFDRWAHTIVGCILPPFMHPCLVRA